MHFQPLDLDGCYVIDTDIHKDTRGHFARTWCKKEFEDHDLNANWVQGNISFNEIKGTIRGMHFQKEPHQEAKLVRVVSGSIFDVVIDLRPNSTSFGKWISVELSAENAKAIYIPKYFAHGFMTMEDNSEVLYEMSEFYHPESASGYRYNDPVFNIKWPSLKPICSDKDLSYPDFSK